jgi:hypothetical protein
LGFSVNRESESGIGAGTVHWISAQWKVEISWSDSKICHGFISISKSSERFWKYSPPDPIGESMWTGPSWEDSDRDPSLRSNRLLAFSVQEISDRISRNAVLCKHPQAGSNFKVRWSQFSRTLRCWRDGGGLGSVWIFPH